MAITRESRDAISRARLFLDKAKSCSGDNRVDFEAFLEAAIVFARAALHRFQAKYKGHPGWSTWWNSLRGNTAVEFFRKERDWILKEASPKVGQIIFAPTIGGPDAYTPDYASEFYYFEAPEIPATDTVARYLVELEKLLADTGTRFSKRDDAV